MSTSASKKISIPALFAGVLTAACVNADSPVENPEYEFRAAIPGDLPVCMADALTHVHGVGTVLVGNDCGNSESAPAFMIWADYNTVFVANALEDLRDNSVCAGVPVEWAAGEWSEAIGGLKTAMCRVEQADGRIDIVLATQAGEMGEGFGEEDPASPRIIYKVYFNSTEPRLESDMQVFREFLRSIVITQDQYLALLDGEPVGEFEILNGVRVSFDGNDALRVVKAGTVLGLSARTPSTLHVSPGSDVAVLNFGEGSGQVLDIEVYRLADGGELDVSEFRASLMEAARSQGCEAPPDVASIIFERWLSDEQFEVSTEDWSRTLDCPALVGTSRIDL